MKKSFLFIVPTLATGGAEKVAYHLMQELKSEGHKVAILAFQPCLNGEHQACKKITPYVWNLSYKGVWKSKKDIKEIIDICNPDIVHSHLASILGLYWLIKKCAPNCKIVNTIHIKIEENFLNRFKSFVSQFWINQFVSVSHYTENWHRNYYKIQKKKYTTVYNGVPIHSESDALFKVPSKKFRIVTVANVHSYKGYMHSLKVVQLLKKKVPSFTYHICGNDQVNPSYTEKLKKYVIENHLQEHVLFHGEIKSTSDFYKDMDICLLLSDKEMLPMSILEAMAEGLPVIVSNVGGVSEILGETKKKDEWGFLVEQKQHQKIKDILLDLATNTELYQLYSKKSLSRVKNFSVGKMIQGYKEVYG